MTNNPLVLCSLSFALCPLLLAWAFVACWAGERPARLSGKVLLLQSERALEGDIEKQGEQYCIRRGSGQLWIEADKVLRLCADWDEAYSFQAARANLADPDERLRLARWCQANGLRERALAEAKAALALSPASTEAKKLAASLQAVPASVSKSGPPPALAAVVQPPPVDVSAESLALFKMRVQPILINACVSCHSGGRGGEFQLVRPREGGQRIAIQKNLAAALAQVDRDRPQLSPLLVKAASVHGQGTQPPLQGGRQSVPFHTLENWVQLVLANNPHLRAEGPTTAAAPAPRPLTEVMASPAMVPQPAQPMGLSPLKGQVVSRTTGIGPSSEPAKAPMAAVIADPFDPMIFNRQMHPQK